MHLKEAGSFFCVCVFVCGCLRVCVCARACVYFNFQNQSSVQWHRAHRVGQLEAALLHRSGRRDIPLHSQFPQDQQIAPSRRLQGMYLHHNTLCSRAQPGPLSAHAAFDNTSTLKVCSAFCPDTHLHVKFLIFTIRITHSVPALYVLMFTCPHAADAYFLNRPDTTTQPPVPFYSAHTHTHPPPM